LSLRGYLVPVEHERQADRLEHEAERMERETDRLEEQIDETRREWEAKEQDPGVPGAQPHPGEDEESVPGVSADEETVSEEGGP
jgi:hypothetical protein